MQYRQLGNTGLSVSVLSLGTSPLGNVFRDINEAEGIRTVHVALDAGINFIDCAPHYGNTLAETVLGQALREIDRERYYLATKVGQYDHGEFDFSADRVRRSIDESMARLGVDYIDLYQCHDIEFAEPSQILHETLPALLKLRDAGRIGHIGITGLPLRCFRNVLDHSEPGVVETVLSFCRYALNDTALAEMLPYLEGKGVGVINASATGMGLLTERGAPDWHPASATIQAGCREAVDFCRREGLDIVRLALQFACHQPAIATTLVGTARPDNILANVAHVEAPYQADAIAAVREILAPIANHNFTRGLDTNRDVVVG